MKWRPGLSPAFITGYVIKLENVYKHIHNTNVLPFVNITNSVYIFPLSFIFWLSIA